MATCYYITKDAFSRLLEEIKELENNALPAVVQEISVARGNGDLSENAEYHAAKEKQRNINRKLKYLKDYELNAKIVECENFTPDVIRFGAYVEMINLDNDAVKTIRLVGDYEADLNKNLISISAPLGQALIGKKAGEIFEVETPGGVLVYEVKSITYQK